MAEENRWYFTPEQIKNTPSRKHSVSETKELSYRQKSSQFIQDLGEKLALNLFCVNNAITYMHRFYMYHSFTDVHWSRLSMAALFLSSKYADQHRRVEHIVKYAWRLLYNTDLNTLDVRSEFYQSKVEALVVHEDILLSTLGFDLYVDQPHTYVVKICRMVNANKELSSTSYLLATTSLQMTTMCLTHKPTIVACVCVFLACKWSHFKIEPCSQGKTWFYYIEPSLTVDKLQDLANRFLEILEAAPPRFKDKVKEKMRSQQDTKLSEKEKAVENARIPATIPSSTSSRLNIFPDTKLSEKEKAVENARIPATIPSSTSSRLNIFPDTKLSEKEKAVENARIPATIPSSTSSRLNIFPDTKLSEKEKAVENARIPATIPSSTSSRLNIFPDTKLSEKEKAVENARIPATIPSSTSSRLNIFPDTKLSEKEKAVENARIPATIPSSTSSRLNIFPDYITSGALTSIPLNAFRDIQYIKIPQQTFHKLEKLQNRTSVSNENKSSELPKKIISQVKSGSYITTPKSDDEKGSRKRTLSSTSSDGNSRIKRLVIPLSR